MPDDPLPIESEAYRRFCSSVEQLPIYCLPWWLQAAVGDERTLRLLSDRDMLTESVMVQPLFEPLGGYVEVPPFCQFTGPLSVISSSPYERKNYAAREEAHSSIARSLSRYKVWRLHFLPEQFDWLPYKQLGATASLFFTHRLFLGEGVEKVRCGYNTLIRRKIKGFEKFFSTAMVGETSIEALLTLVQNSWEHSGATFMEKQSLRRIVQAALERKKGIVRAVYPDASSSTPLAAVFIAHHNSTAYYIAGGRSTQADPTGNGLAFLLDAVLEELCSIPSITMLDFEGSMEQGIAFFFRSFGAIPTPYLRVQKGQLTWSRRWRRRRFYKKNIV